MENDRLSVLMERAKFLQDCKNNYLAIIDRSLTSSLGPPSTLANSRGQEMFRKLEESQARSALENITKNIPIIDGIMYEVLREISEIRGMNGNKRQ